MPWLLIIPLLFCLPIIFTLIFWWYRKRKRRFLLQDFSQTIPKDASYEFLKRKKRGVVEVGKEWPIQSMYLMHGTFVGDDPFDLISLIKKNFPRLNDNIIQSVRDKTKKGQDLVAKDLGNFLPEHIELIKEKTDSNFNVHNITWSSGNHHYARVRGLIDLITSIAAYEERGSHIMLVGHSHAGQIFALLGQIFHNDSLKKKLFGHFKEKYDLTKIYADFEIVKSLHIDIVTFGTPARYEWNLAGNMRLLHFINHRSREPIGGTFAGVTQTRDGDYIQQWGVAGSDIRSPIEDEDRINQELEQLLGAGHNLEQLKQNIKLRRRLHNTGHHYLVDYGDKALFPNFLQTAFGHGVYTRIRHLDFHLEIIFKHFYN